MIDKKIFGEGFKGFTPAEKLNAEIKVNKFRLFFIELNALSFDKIDEDFDKMIKNLNLFIEEKVNGNNVFNNVARQSRENKIGKKGTDKKLNKILQSIKKRDDHFNIFISYFYRSYNNFVTSLQLILTPLNVIAAAAVLDIVSGDNDKNFTAELLKRASVESPEILKGVEDLKSIEAMDINKLITLVSQKYRNQGITFNNTNFHLLRQMRNYFSHRDSKNALELLQIQTLKSFEIILKEIREEYEQLKELNIIPLTEEETKTFEVKHRINEQQFGISR